MNLIKHLIIGSVLILFLLMWACCLDAVVMPFEEFSNAKTAYEYHIEKTNCTGYNCGPSCSLQARMWIDEYREDHNLTDDEFLCAVWFNDQSDWFYY